LRWVSVALQDTVLKVKYSNVMAWKTSPFGSGRKPASIPDGSRVYAVGDVHGRLDLLQKIWRMMEADARGADKRTTIVFLGDYVDRGPDSKGVVDFLLEAKLQAKSQQREVVCLRGNHDQSILDFIADAGFYEAWWPYGAPETLLSYGVAPPAFDAPEALEEARRNFMANCPLEHIRFFQDLPYSHSIGGYMFVHAGVRPGIPLGEQDSHDLLWIRDEFLTWRRPFAKVIVHGHTPQGVATREENRIGIDTAAYETDRLSAAVLEGTECRFLST
jgi:serine/threonine protein phosphatase 1